MIGTVTRSAAKVASAFPTLKIDPRNYVVYPLHT